MSSLYCHNSFLRTSLRRERRPGPATATSCTKTPRQRTPKHIGITVRKEMNCSGDSEIQHEIVRDTTRISSCFSDFRVVSWSIFIKTFCVLIFLYTTISSFYLSVIFFINYLLCLFPTLGHLIIVPLMLSTTILDNVLVILLIFQLYL